MSNWRHQFLRQYSPPDLLAMAGTFLLVIALISGCTASRSTAANATPNLSIVFLPANTIQGWEISQKVTTYQHDNLFSLVDGQADSFFAYGFEQVAVQRYQNGAGILLNAEIWQLADPADAFGLFSTVRAGIPASVGNEGDSDPGRRLAFWQNRFFVSLEALNPIPDETLQAFARAIAGKLPAGGERPAIVGRLPQEGLAENSLIFFHEEMSIQMQVWLGGENILGLSQATNGALGQYQVGNAAAWLMLVEYPNSGQAAKGLKALQNGNVADLSACDVRGNLLGAVFGRVDATQAQTLLQEALK